MDQIQEVNEEMEKGFNLIKRETQEIIINNNVYRLNGFLMKDDVKEFIRLLKEWLKEHKQPYDSQSIVVIVVRILEMWSI